MTVASLELCKQLYELSGWQDVDESIFSSVTEKLDWIYDAPSGLWWLPAYDAGYLLRKLPRRIDLIQLHEKRGWLASRSLEGLQAAVFKPNPQGIADTPEDALAQLAIELFKSGVLKKGVA